MREFEDPYILLNEGKLSNLHILLPLEASQNLETFLIIAEDVEGSLATPVGANKPRGGLGVAVKAPGFADRRKSASEDIAILTGGQGYKRRTRY